MNRTNGHKQGFQPRLKATANGSRGVRERCVVETELLGGSAERARLAVSRLEEAGVLRRTAVGRRNRAWETIGLFDLLDRFERELGSPEHAPRGDR